MSPPMSGNDSFQKKGVSSDQTAAAAVHLRTLSPDARRLEFSGTAALIIGADRNEYYLHLPPLSSILLFTKGDDPVIFRYIYDHE